MSGTASVVYVLKFVLIGNCRDSISQTFDAITRHRPIAGHPIAQLLEHRTIKPKMVTKVAVSCSQLVVVIVDH
jgi:hypothetical protein